MAEIIELEKAKEAGAGFGHIIVASPAMKKVMAQARAVAKLDINVFIAGETGVGKEEVAKLIHLISGRRKLVCLNAANFPETLVESELFGTVKGSFTGSKNSQGFFKQADKGTLFLDEISKISLSVQAKLLRVVEEKKFYPVGGREPISSDFRFLSASAENLEEMVSQNKFRADLYHRLTTCVIAVPPLRERPEDIIPLAKHFLRLNCQKMAKPVKGLSRAAQDYLLSQHWPGNVRELQNAVIQALIACDNDVLEPEDFQARRITAGSSSRLDDNDDCYRVITLSQKEKEIIVEALRKNFWSISAAAKELGVGRDAIRYRVKKFNIKHPYGAWQTYKRVLNEENLIRALREGGSLKNAAYLLGTSISHIKLLLSRYQIEFDEQAEVESERIKATALNIKKQTEKLEKKLIKKALALTDGNKAAAARLLGLYRPELYKKMKKYGLADNFGRPKK